jgi:hypothetical protein
MAGSTLDPDNIPARKGRKTVKGTDVKSLGPSDTSDSGSDMAGPGLVDDERLHLDRGTNEDPEAGTVGKIEAGAAVGDRPMDDTSDASGTGEHLTAGKDPRVRPNADRDTDRSVAANEAGLGGGLDPAEEARLGKTDEQLARSGTKSGAKKPKR